MFDGKRSLNKLYLMFKKIKFDVEKLYVIEITIFDG